MFNHPVMAEHIDSRRGSRACAMCENAAWRPCPLRYFTIAERHFDWRAEYAAYMRSVWRGDGGGALSTCVCEGNLLNIGAVKQYMGKSLRRTRHGVNADGDGGNRQCESNARKRNVANAEVKKLSACAEIKKRGISRAITLSPLERGSSADIMTSKNQSIL